MKLPLDIVATLLALTDLGPLPAVVLDGRGTFDGDRTVLQFDLVDRTTGKLLWTRTVAKDIDPCDGGDVAKLVEVALRGQSWARARR